MVDVPQGDRSPDRADPPATTISLRPRAWLESLHARRSAHLKHSRSYGERVILSVLLAGKQGRISTQGKHIPQAPRKAAYTYLVTQQHGLQDAQPPFGSLTARLRGRTVLTTFARWGGANGR